MNSKLLPLPILLALSLNAAAGWRLDGRVFYDGITPTGKVDYTEFQDTNAIHRAGIETNAANLSILATGTVNRTEWTATNLWLESSIGTNSAEISVISTGKTDITAWQETNAMFQAALANSLTNTLHTRFLVPGADLHAAYVSIPTNDLAATSRGALILLPGTYNLTAPLLMTNEFVDLLSVTGQRDVFFTGSNIHFNADNIRVAGIDFTGTDEGYLRPGNDKPNQLFSNIASGSWPFHVHPPPQNIYWNNRTFSGTFHDSQLGNNLGRGNNASVSGTFIRCTIGSSFTMQSNYGFSGRLQDCIVGSTAGGWNSSGWSGTAIDTTFGNDFGMHSSTSPEAVFRGCTFGRYALASATAQGLFIDCTFGENFVFNTGLQGLAINCRLGLTHGPATGNGAYINSIDYYGDILNRGTRAWSFDNIHFDDDIRFHRTGAEQLTIDDGFATHISDLNIKAARTSITGSGSTTAGVLSIFNSSNNNGSNFGVVSEVRSTSNSPTLIGLDGTARPQHVGWMGSLAASRAIGVRGTFNPLTAGYGLSGSGPAIGGYFADTRASTLYPAACSIGVLAYSAGSIPAYTNIALYAKALPGTTGNSFAIYAEGPIATDGFTGKSVTNAWITLDGLTNRQVFVNGILTSWQVNDADL